MTKFHIIPFCHYIMRRENNLDVLFCWLAMTIANNKQYYKNPLHLGEVDRYVWRKEETIPGEFSRRRRYLYTTSKV